MFQPSPSRQAHKLAIINLVLTKKKGDTVTKEEISAATRVSESDWKSSLDVARKTLQAGHRIVLDPIHGVGYKIAEPSDMPSIVASHLRKSHNQARRALSKASSVSKEEVLSLSKDEQQEFFLQKQCAAFAVDATSPKKLRDLAIVNRKELPSIAGLEND